MSNNTVRFRHLVGVCILLLLGCLSSCGYEKKAKTATATVDTTVVDDDTLEVNDGSNANQTEHAR